MDLSQLFSQPVWVYAVVAYGLYLFWPKIAPLIKGFAAKLGVNVPDTLTPPTIPPTDLSALLRWLKDNMLTPVQVQEIVAEVVANRPLVSAEAVAAALTIQQMPDGTFKLVPAGLPPELSPTVKAGV